MVTSSRVHRARIAAYCGAFFAVGGALALPGAALEALAKHASESEAELWPVFLVRGLAYTMASFVGGVLGDAIGASKRGAHALMAGSMFVAGAGVWCAWSARSVAGIAVAIGAASIAMGVLDTVGNLATMKSCEDAGRGASSDMSVVHAFFGVGCMAMPAFAAVLGHAAVFALASFALVASGLVLLALPGVALTGGTSTPPHLDDVDDRGIRAKMAALVLIFCYVGAEQGAGGLIETVGRVSLGLASRVSLAVTSGFWLALFLGRVASALVPDDGGPSASRSDAMLLAAMGLSVIAACALAILSGARLGSGGGGAFAVVVFCLGFGYGPVYPVAFARLEARLGGISPIFGGILVAAGGLGEMFIPAVLFWAWRAQGAVALACVLALLASVDAGAWGYVLLETAKTREGGPTQHNQPARRVGSGPSYEKVGTVENSVEIELRNFLNYPL